MILKIGDFTKSALVRITTKALEKGIIPRICPICKNPTEKLAVHHWGDEAYDVGDKYRRVCESCNAQLGILFKGEYPDTWEKQYKVLVEKILAVYPVSYPFCDGIEGDWSRITEQEVELVLKEGDTARYGIDFSSLFKDVKVISVEAPTRSEAIDEAARRLGIDPQILKGVRGTVKVTLESPWAKDHSRGILKAEKIIEKSMKIVQREVEDGRLKVDLLTGLLDLKEKLENDRGSTEE